MRDKVKRFLSILMTTLMLVNLLPVGALAEGFTISNSVQSIGWWDGYPVFVFVKVEGDTTGLTMNSDHWFTLGMVKSMDGVTKPPKPVTGYQDTINGVTAKDVIAVMTRYEPNESINLGGITWKGFKSEHGASNTYPAYTNQACWHLDGSIRIEDLQVDYTIRYVDENNKEIASSKKKTDKAGSWTKLEKEDIKDITGYTYTDRHDPMQKLVGGKDTVINVYYTTNSYEYKVEHYYDGEIDPSRTDTIRALYGSTVEEYNLELKPKGGYEHETTVNCPLTITEDESKNVIKVYYTKQTDLSYTVNYLEKVTNKVLHDQKVQGGMTYEDTITSANEKIDISGYNYDSVDPETLTIGTGENVINIYYTKRTDLSYKVNYLEKNTNKVLHDQKVQNGVTFETEITSANEVIEINGYNYDSVDKDTLKIGTGENVINIYYTKRNDLSYTVNYLEKDTLNVLHNPKVQDGMTFDEVVNSADEVIEINGYNYDSVVPEETLTIGTGENVINIYYTKRTDLSYTVNYLEKDTDKVLSPQKVKDGMTFGTVITSSDEVIKIDGYNYDSVDKDTLEIGTGDNVINIYYTKRTDLSYKVNYLEKDTDKVLSPQKVKDGMTFGTVITSSDEVIKIDGYNYDSVDKDTLEIGTGDNVINIYYTKRTDLSYKVNYLEKDTNKVLHDAKTVENQTFEAVVNPADEKIAIDGYNYVGADKEKLTIGTGENVLNLYYTKRTDLSYTVNYLEKDTNKVLHEAKTVDKQTFGDTVTETAIDVQGYNKVDPTSQNLTVTADPAENVITFYYTKRTDLSYTVNYYWNGTTEKVAESKTVNDQTFEAVIKEAPILIDGYTPISLERQELTITTDDNDNTITFYYYKNVKLTANSDTLPYNGEEQSVSGYTCAVEEKQKDGSVEYVPWTGEKPLTFEGVSASGLGKDVNENGYPVTFNDTPIGVNDGLYYVNESQTGTLTITPRAVTLTSETAGKTYDGTALEKPVVTVGGDGFVEGQVKEIKATGSVTNAGSVANTITFTPNKETFKEGNYAITKTEGTLTIAKRSVLITSPSATKTYDGSALTRPAVTITGDGFVPGELAKAEATGSITNVGSTPNAIRYTTTGAFNAANYSIALSVGTLTVTEKPKPEPRRTFNLTINYVYQNGKRAAASYNRGGLKNGETFDITSPVIAGYTASETVVSGTIYNRDIKVTVIYTADGVNLDDYGVPLGLGNITMNVGDCFE